MGELEKAKENLPAEIADYFNAAPSEDMSRMDQNDVIMPRLTLLQSKSPEVEQEGIARAGQVMEKGSKRIYLEEPKDGVIEMIPVFHWSSRIRFWPRDSVDGQGIRCQSFDSVTGKGDPGGECFSCEHALWGSRLDGKAGTECLHSINFLVYVTNTDHEQKMVIVSFSRTAEKIGKELANAILQGGQGRIFTKKYQLGAFMDKGHGNVWWNYRLVRWEGLNRLDKALDPATDGDLVVELARINEQMAAQHKRGSSFTADDSPARKTESATAPLSETMDENATPF